MATVTPPTLEDVARRAGVSTATVSRCINLPDQLLPATRDKVQAAITELSYTPHFGGVALASKKTNTVAAIIPTMSNAIFAHGLQAFEETMTDAKVNVLIASSHYNPERELQHIKTLIARGADGLLLIGTHRPQSTYTFLQQRQTPYVLSWCYHSDNSHYYTGFDNCKAAYKITERVIRHGHRRIAMISAFTKDNDRASDRVKGVRQALHNHQLDGNALPIIETRYSLQHGGKALLHILKHHPETSVVVCGNDVLAVGAMIAAQRQGIKIPEDLSITGFDDIELAQAVQPQLTTVHVPHTRMGHSAAQLLLRLRDGEMPPKSIEIETSITERGSLAVIHQQTDTPS